MEYQDKVKGFIVKSYVSTWRTFIRLFDTLKTENWQFPYFENTNKEKDHIR